MYSAQSNLIILFLCRLFCWNESKFMTKSHFTAAFPGLIVSDVNFNLPLLCSQPWILFSACLVSYCFCIIGTPCPIKIWSPGHFVLSGAKKKKRAHLTEIRWVQQHLLTSLQINQGFSLILCDANFFFHFPHIQSQPKQWQASPWHHKPTNVSDTLWSALATS